MRIRKENIRQFSVESLHSLISQTPRLSIESSILEHQLQTVFAKTLTAENQQERRTLCQSKKPKRTLKSKDIEKRKNQLTHCCLTHIQDSYRVHLNRLRGIDILEQLVDQAEIDKIPSDLAVHMLWACLSCIHHFLLRLRANGGLIQWIRRRQARKAIEVYDKLLAFLAPTYYTVLLNGIITFYEEANLWDIEYFCSNLLGRLLLQSEKDKAESINEILNLIENSTLTNAMTSRQILQVLFDIEEELSWRLLDDQITDRFLDMYYRSLTPNRGGDYNYEALEKGLETSLRAMTVHFTEKELMFMIKVMLEITTLEEISDDNLLNFGSLIEHVTNLYNIRAQKRALPEQVFPLIIKLIASDNLLYSLLGNRVLHNLIDRNNNKLIFDTPRIFLRNCHYNIVLHDYNSTDKQFFQRHRELFHTTFVASVFKHGMHKIHLENIYMSIVLFLVEIPCGYTAAAAVCLGMAIQEAALKSKRIEITHAHRLHATVISIMSLVCYIHKADVFYDYVEKIIESRANFAPHLNPPLKMSYKYAQHHILWNKSDFFFEDWEARYGLWRCFKNKYKNLVIIQHK